MFEPSICSKRADRYTCAGFTEGRGNLVGAPLGAVLIPIDPDITRYLSFIDSTRSGQRLQYFGAPSSVNYAIGADGEVFSIVPEQDTSWAIFKVLHPTHPNPAFVNVLEPNQPLITIGLCGLSTDQTNTGITDLQATALLQLLCCLYTHYGWEYNRETLSVYYDFNNTHDDGLGDVPTWLLEQVAGSDGALCTSLRANVSRLPCIATGSIVATSNTRIGNPITTSLVESPNPSPIGNLPIQPACCTALGVRVTLLEELLSETTIEDLLYIRGLQTVIEVLQANNLVLTNRVNTFNTQIATLQQEYAAVLRRFLSIQSCLDCVCPPDNALIAVDYEYSSGYTQTVVRGNPTWLSLPVQISDTTPPSVVVGALWTYNPDATCTAREVSYNIRFAPAEYCAGCGVQVYIVICGVATLLQEVNSVGGLDTLNLTGTYILTAPASCHEIHFTVGTTDNQSPLKVITYARVTIACV